MTPRRVDSWWAQWACVGGTCAPPAPPASSRLDRMLDAYIRITAPFLRGCMVFATVAAVWVVSYLLGPLAGLLVQAAFLLLAAAYCLANFARCREAHCIVTGLGWSVLALGCLAAAVAGRDVRGAAWLAFLAVAVAGHGFEAMWKASHGSNALRLSPRQR